MRFNRLKKYQRFILLYLIDIAIWLALVIILHLIFTEKLPNLSKFLPFDNFLTELFFIYVIVIPISGIFGLLIGGYLFAPIILRLHKKLSRKRFSYGYYQIQSEEKIIYSLKGYFLH
jgi:hypothetical protein